MDIILATGGTGGHIFPAIALAKTLKMQGYNCILFTDRKTERNAHVESYVLPLSKPGNNKFFLLLVYSCILALYRIRRLKPKLVIGFGGYASFSTLLAAKILSIPIILHEQNIILGRVNRFFFKGAKLIATSFPETKYAEGNKCIFTGNFVNIRACNYFNIKKILNILVIAGSQGANFFDDAVSDIICNLPIKIKKKIRVIQQCTKKNMDMIKDLYKRGGIKCELSKFFYNMESRLANAHLVISRAGATSISEITLAKRPAVYIPYPYSKDNHQFYNAKYIEDSGAAIIIEQNGEARKNLQELLIDLLNNPYKLYDIASNTERIRIKDGIAEFIKVIYNNTNS
ncbi:MAG: UDP-N-acetylglucosamine--N-acetylmuramyl-(pentapeptide) pyrophosphoryl-undecaprenol N-acetylglucosamine transferase [Wolbachia sp.]